MLDMMHTNGSQRTFLASLYIWFLRIMAVFSLSGALLIWAQLTGVTHNGELQFDILETHWRMLKTILAVILPAAGLGLWMTQSWGVVLWLLAMGLEILAYGVWSDLYEYRSMTLVTHGIVITFWALLSIALYFEKRRMQRIGLEHL